MHVHDITAGIEYTCMHAWCIAFYYIHACMVKPIVHVKLSYALFAKKSEFQPRL